MMESSIVYPVLYFGISCSNTKVFLTTKIQLTQRNHLRFGRLGDGKKCTLLI